MLLEAHFSGSGHWILKYCLHKFADFSLCLFDNYFSYLKIRFSNKAVFPLCNCHENYTWKIKAFRGRFTFISCFWWSPSTSKIPTQRHVSAQTFKIPGGLHGTGVQPGCSQPSIHWSLGWGPQSCQSWRCLAGALPLYGPHCWGWAEPRNVRAWLKLDRKGPVGAHFPQEKPWVERIQCWVASSQRLPTL